MISKIDEKIKKQKLKALANIMKSVAKKTGDDNMIQILGQVPFDNSNRLPTGNISLDVATGGGFKRGRLIECYGAESSGKSLIAQKTIAANQKLNCLCAYIDVEQTFDPTFARKLGVNTDELIISQPSCLEDAFTVMEGLIEAGVDVIVLDSIAAMITKDELEATDLKQTVGLLARKMSQALKKINQLCAKSNSIVIFINQMRDDIGAMGYGPKETTPGGKAMKFYASYRLRVSLSIDGKLYADSKKENCIGQGIKVKIVKNKTAPPFKVAEFKVYFDGRKVDEVDDIADLAVRYNIIPRYNAKGIADPHGRTFKWANEPKFSASSKADVPIQLHKFPKMVEEIKEIIVSGKLEGEVGEAEEDLDADLTDEQFEEIMQEEARNVSEAEEIEESSWNE